MGTTLSRPAENQNPDLYALDAGWFAPLGLWRGPEPEDLGPEERQQALAQHLARQPFVMVHSANEPGSRQLSTLTVTATYDAAHGVFDYKMVYWWHLPESDPGQRADSDQHILHIRGVLDGYVDGIPRIIPDQIWAGGSLLFNGPANGGTDNPDQPKHARLLTRALEAAQRVHERLFSLEPLHKLGAWLAARDESDENFFAKLIGGKPHLRGLNEEGWDPYHRVVRSSFGQRSAPDGKVTLTFKPLGSLTPFDRLKGALGHYTNTIEPLRSTLDASGKHAADPQTGIGYRCHEIYAKDPKTGHHVFRLRIQPTRVPSDTEPAAPFDVMELAFSQPTPHSFRLERVRCMGREPETSAAAALDHIGAYQDINRARAHQKFPAIFDILMRHGLFSWDKEFHMPPPLSKGGEMLWVTISGVGMEKKVEHFGDEIGGGNVFLQRGTTEEGDVDEIAVCHDLSYAASSPDTDFDGAQPDIMRYQKALRRGVIFVSHCHYDHATIQNFASQIDQHGKGWLRGQKILCKGRDADIMKLCLQKVGVEQENWPSFIIYDKPGAVEENPDLFRLNKHHYAYRIRDEKGNTRFWLQVVRNGTKHSARTDMCFVTGCVNDTFNETYCIPSDTLDINPQGWEALEQGQFALVGLPGVSEEGLKKAAPDPEKRYILLAEATSAIEDGAAPTYGKVGGDLLTLIKAVPEDHVVFVVPFSTNDLDIQLAIEAAGKVKRNIVAIGANAEHRLTIMNKHGIDPDLDLSEVVIPHDLLPVTAYDLALVGIEEYLAKQREAAEKLSRQQKGRLTPEEVLARNHSHQIVAYVAEQARAAKAEGNERPRILFDMFFNRQDGEPENAPLRALGAAQGLDVSQDIVAPFAAIRRHISRHLKERLEPPAFDTDFFHDTWEFMLRSLYRDGRVKFEASNLINETLNYHAIMAGERIAARRAVRSSAVGKRFREKPGHLLGIATGPLGTYEERMAWLSRFLRGDSLTDYDEWTRVTGYKLDPKKMTVIVMQTPSMGPNAALAQQSLTHAAAYARGTTVHVGTKNGTLSINPMGYRERYERILNRFGFYPKATGAQQDLYTPNLLLSTLR